LWRRPNRRLSGDWRADLGRIAVNFGERQIQFALKHS
jgi:hypothetical protein